MYVRVGFSSPSNIDTTRFTNFLSVFPSAFSSSNVPLGENIVDSQSHTNPLKYNSSWGKIPYISLYVNWDNNVDRGKSFRLQIEASCSITYRTYTGQYDPETIHTVDVHFRFDDIITGGFNIPLYGDVPLPDSSAFNYYHVQFPNDVVWQLKTKFLEELPCDDRRSSESTQCGLLTLNGIGVDGNQQSEQYTFCIQPDSNNTSGEITFPNLSAFFTFVGGSFRFTSGVVRGDGIIRVFGRLDESNSIINTEGQLGLEVESSEILLFQAQFAACCDYPIMVSGQRDYTPEIDKFGILSGFATITPTRIEWQGFENLSGYCCDGVSCDDDYDFPLDWDKLGGDDGDDEMIDLTCVCDALDQMNLNIQNGNVAIVGALEQKLGQLKTSIDNKQLSVDVDLDAVVAKLQAIKESIDDINPEQDFDGIINKLQAIKQSIDDKVLSINSTGIEAGISGLSATLGGINFGGSALTTNLPGIVNGIGGLTTLFTTLLPALFSAGSDLLNALIGLKQSSDLVSIKDEIGDLKDSLDGLSDVLEDVLTCDDDTLACILKSALNTSNEDCSQGLADVINDKKIEPSADVNVTVTPSDNVSIAKVQYLSRSED